MMIDVVGAKRGARQALEQVIFFVGGAVRPDESDRIRTVDFDDLLQLGGRGLRGFFPGDGIELVTFANQTVA